MQTLIATSSSIFSFFSSLFFFLFLSAAFLNVSLAVLSAFSLFITPLCFFISSKNFFIRARLFLCVNRLFSFFSTPPILSLFILGPRFLGAELGVSWVVEVLEGREEEGVEVGGVAVGLGCGKWWHGEVAA